MKVILLLQAFSYAIFRISGTSRGPSASAEVLILMMEGAAVTVLFFYRKAPVT